jgi:predicted metalloprotease with PDZ domain
MNHVEFYNVKKKTKVQVSSSKVEKKVYERTTKNGNLSVRYAFSAVDDDGTKLTKFCSKADYDALQQG